MPELYKNDKEVFTEINEEYAMEVYKCAHQFFGDGIYVKSDNHPCGWDFISFEMFEVPSDMLDEPLDNNAINDGNYDYSDFENKAMLDVLKMVGMQGWCFERSGVEFLI